MPNIDQDFVEYIVKSLVNKPEAVIIERSIDEKGVLLQLTVDPEDLGRVIGKRGNTAQSIRTLLRALGTKNDARYNLKIVDNGEDKPARERNFDQDNANAPSAPAEQSDQPETPVAVSPWAHLSSSSSDDNAQDDDDDQDDQDDSKEENEASNSEQEPESESVVEKTKKELADLGDLDI